MSDHGDQELLAHRFEADRARLRGVAFRMLGSMAEAEDAVQEAWLRLDRADADDVVNLSGWLTTVVARVCLDQLRSRKFRREDPVGVSLPEEEGTVVAPDGLGGAASAGGDPAHEAELADSVGLALLVVLDTLTPAERLAFVLHDLFAVSFDEIAPIVDRTPAAARQLASRARRRVQTSPRAEGEADRSRRHAVVEAFLAASRGGDFEALLTVLDPDVVFRSDRNAVALGGPAELRGAHAVAQSFCGRADAAFPALLDGEFGLIVAPKPDRVLLVLRVTITDDGRISALEAVADRAALGAMDLVRLGD